eukprot:6263919-Amphidinium_carterae.1
MVLIRFVRFSVVARVGVGLILEDDSQSQSATPRDDALSLPSQRTPLCIRREFVLSEDYLNLQESAYEMEEIDVPVIEHVRALHRLINDNDVKRDVDPLENSKTVLEGSTNQIEVFSA